MRSACLSLVVARCGAVPSLRAQIAGAPAANAPAPVSPIIATSQLILSDYTVAQNQFDTITFKPVATTGLRLEVQFQTNWSAGLASWKVK